MASLEAHLCERLKIILTLKLQNLSFYHLTPQFILAIRNFDFYAYFTKTHQTPLIVIDNHHNWLSLSQINDCDPLINHTPPSRSSGCAHKSQIVVAYPSLLRIFALFDHLNQTPT